MHGSLSRAPLTALIGHLTYSNDSRLSSDTKVYDRQPLVRNVTGVVGLPRFAAFSTPEPSPPSPLSIYLHRHMESSHLRYLCEAEMEVIRSEEDEEDGWLTAGGLGTERLLLCGEESVGSRDRSRSKSSKEESAGDRSRVRKKSMSWSGEVLTQGEGHGQGEMETGIGTVRGVVSLVDTPLGGRTYKSGDNNTATGSSASASNGSSSSFSGYVLIRHLCAALLLVSEEGCGVAEAAVLALALLQRPDIALLCREIQLLTAGFDEHDGSSMSETPGAPVTGSPQSSVMNDGNRQQRATAAFNRVYSYFICENEG